DLAHRATGTRGTFLRLGEEVIGKSDCRAHASECTTSASRCIDFAAPGSPTVAPGGGPAAGPQLEHGQLPSPALAPEPGCARDVCIRLHPVRSEEWPAAPRARRCHSSSATLPGHGPGTDLLSLCTGTGPRLAG